MIRVRSASKLVPRKLKRKNETTGKAENFEILEWKPTEKVKKPKKIVVSADKFNTFEDSNLNKNKRKLSISSESSESEKVEENTVQKFEEITIKEEFINFDVDKTNDSAKKVGVKQNIKVSNDTTSLINNTTSTSQSTAKRVFLIKNLAGKSVTLVPKNTPVVLKQNACDLKSKNVFNNLPNTPIINISDVNKSQKYFTASKNKNCEKVMPDFSKILYALTETPEKNEEVTKIENIPIYVDSQTQTEILKTFKDSAVQTDVYVPAPVSPVEDFPNITNLLEYIFNTPNYSTGLDEGKKLNLIDLSKNIAMKGKTVQENSGKIKESDLKTQLFSDLRECVFFDFLGNKPIHNAVLENNLVVLKRQIFALRSRKISVDVENNQGQTALQMAVINNCNIEVVSALLGNGADVYITDNEGNNLLHLAVMNSDHLVLGIVIQYMTEISSEINRKNDEGLTPLMIAAIEQKPEMVDMLLRHNADPNLRDEKSGRTALFHAVELNSNLVINLLLRYKADPKVRNFFGLTALDAAKDLDIPEAKILDNDNQNENSQVLKIKKRTADNPENGVDCGKKVKIASPVKKNKSAAESVKKSKLCFVPSLQKLNPSVLENISVKKRRK